jgi:hypothetical protein
MVLALLCVRRSGLVKAKVILYFYPLFILYFYPLLPPRNVSGRAEPQRRKNKRKNENEKGTRSAERTKERKTPKLIPNPPSLAPGRDLGRNSARSSSRDGVQRKRDVQHWHAACACSGGRRIHSRRSTTTGNTPSTRSTSTGGGDDSGSTSNSSSDSDNGRSNIITKNEVELGKRLLVSGKEAQVPGGDSRLDDEGIHPILNQNVERNDVGLELEDEPVKTRGDGGGLGEEDCHRFLGSVEERRNANNLFKIRGRFWIGHDWDIHVKIFFFFVVVFKEEVLLAFGGGGGPSQEPAKEPDGGRGS